MSKAVDHLEQIVARKRIEVARRLRRAESLAELARRAPGARAAGAVEALRRGVGEPPKVIAEIKFRSPSAGTLRARRPGAVANIAEAYVRGGAAAISVLCDGPGFGGTPLDVARATRRVRVPVLFKEFVIDPVQLDVARAVGASLVLLLARVLSDAELARLIGETRARGMEPVVEAADEAELQRALRTDATIVGVNARDLRSFQVDSTHAARLVDEIPADRVAVFMSGVRTAQDFARVRETRADAVLIGEGLMRQANPETALVSFLREA